MIYVLLTEYRQELSPCHHDSSWPQFRSTRCRCCEGHQRIPCKPGKAFNTNKTAERIKSVYAGEIHEMRTTLQGWSIEARG